MSNYANFEDRKKAQAEAVDQQILNRTGKIRQDRMLVFRPPGYKKPAYNTPEYYRDWKLGLIPDEEAKQDTTSYEIRRKRAKDSYNKKAPLPDRHSRPPPRESKQWCRPMATTAARDDRLTPQAKALLQVLTARAGEGRVTDTTKTTLADIMNRCPRSIQRYISELIKFGYIMTQWKKCSFFGYYTGLRIWIMNKVLPYFTVDAKSHYNAEDYTQDLPESGRNSDRTEFSLINNNIKISNRMTPKYPPWIKKIAL